MHHADRRTRRSDRQVDALQLYLDACAARSAARAVVLSDRDGLLIGGSGAGDLELVAALGTLLVPGVSSAERAGHEALFEQAGAGAPIHASPLVVDGLPAVLTTVGACALDPVEAGHAVTRILRMPHA